MKNYTYLTLIILSCTMTRCNSLENDENGIKKENLIGKWNAYLAIGKDGLMIDNPSDILQDYEHGFQLNDDGTYNPRYLDQRTMTFYTSDKVHHWELIDNELLFGDYDPNGNLLGTKGRMSGFKYKIIKASENELWIGEQIEYRLKKD